MQPEPERYDTVARLELEIVQSDPPPAAYFKIGRVQARTVFWDIEPYVKVVEDVTMISLPYSSEAHE